MTNQQEKEYAKHFNNGYMLAKHEPKLFSQIMKENEKTPGLQAMKEGGREVEREKGREQFKQMDAQKDKNKDLDKEL